MPSIIVSQRAVDCCGAVSDVAIRCPTALAADAQANSFANQHASGIATPGTVSIDSSWRQREEGKGCAEREVSLVLVAHR